MAKTWRVHPHDPQRIATLARTAGVPAVVAQILLARGITERDRVEEFMKPKLSALCDPDDLPGVLEAAGRLHKAIADREAIVVYGDYDVDGISATSLLYRALKLLGAQVSYFVPNRADEGYGLNNAALERLARERNAKIVVTVDCGITAVAQVAFARDLGLEVIVTDHHTPGPQLPEALVVHPGLPAKPYSFPQLCGAGVALKLAWGACRQAEGARRVSSTMKDYLCQAVGYAALGTVGDVVPLLNENRVLVTHGLKVLKSQPSIGIKALLDVCELKNKRELDSEDLAFKMVPRLNAAGRLAQAELAVELLTTDDQERASSIAVYFGELNAHRQKLEQRVCQAAKRQAEEQFDPHNDPALVLASHDWHKGVIGLAAGRLANDYHRPALLIALDRNRQGPGQGSVRGVIGIDVHQALTVCQEHLLKFGGHRAAAGLTVEEHQIPALRTAFCDAVSQQWGADEPIPELFLDGEATLSQFTLQVVDQINQLGPFGEGNPRPHWCTVGVELAQPPRKMGGDRHFNAQFRQGDVTLRGVAFNRGDWADEMARLNGRAVDIAFRPVINEFRGTRSVELHLEDWRPSIMDS